MRDRGPAQITHGHRCRASWSAVAPADRRRRLLRCRILLGRPGRRCAASAVVRSGQALSASREVLLLLLLLLLLLHG